MNKGRELCNSLPHYWDLKFAQSIAAQCQRLSGANFRAYQCRYCQRYHVTVKRQAKARQA